MYITLHLVCIIAYRATCLVRHLRPLARLGGAKLQITKQMYRYY